MKFIRLALSALMLLTILTPIIPTLAAETSSKTMDKESNDSFATATDIGFGQSTTGYISTSGDADYYRVPTTFLGNAALTLSVPHDYDLYVYDQDQHLLASSKRLGDIMEKIDLYVNSTTTQLYVKVEPYGKAFSKNEPYTLTTTRLQ